MFFGSDEDDGGAFSFGMPTQPKGSNLSSLFGGPQVTAGNESLMYTPQKPPSKAKEPTKEAKPPPDTPQLLFASVCHAFKYIDGQYAPQGKLGAAVLGHLANKDYKILLYQSQKKPITNARIHQNFTFNILKNNYATFYDDQSQNWSVCFDNETQQAEFAKWVCLARFNVTPSLTLQDLNAVDGQEVRKGDTVEMQYTGWLHAGNAFGKVFDSNKETGKLLKFKVGKGKVIKGWETGVIGMKKGMKRLLVIPSDQAYGAKAVGDKVPANSILIFHIELTRVKFVNPQSDPDTVSLTSVDGSQRKDSMKVEEQQPKDQPKDAVDGNTDEEKDTVIERTKSISEQLSKTPDTKSKLLERMSKMGQAMIPAPNAQKSDEETAYSDETTKPIPIERHPSHESSQSPVPGSPRPNLKPKPETHPRTHEQYHSQPPPQHQQHQQPQQPPLQHQQHQQYQQQPLQPQPLQQQAPVYVNQAMYQQPLQQQNHQMDPSLYFQQPQQPQQLALYQSPQAIQNSLLASINPALAQQTIQQSSTGVSSAEINLMMTDGKLKHNELKNDLTRLLEKLDAISTKVTSLESSSKQMQVAMPQQAAEMEAAVLMQNITRIITENAKLQTECEEKSRKIEKLNESMTDLLTKNQSFFEKSNQLLANQSDSMQNNAAQAMAKVSVLEQRTIQLEADLSASRTQLLHAQKKEEAYGSKSAELTVEIEILQKQVKQYKEQINNSSSSTNEHEDALADLKQQVKAAKKEQKQLSMKLEQSEEECSEVKQEVGTFTKSLADMKKKRKEEKTKHDEELEELRAQHEEEMRNLKQRYGKSASSETEKLNKLEEELTSKFDEKMRRKIKTLENEHKEKLDEMQKENEKLTEDLKASQTLLKNASERLSAEYDEKVQAQLSEANKKHEVNLEEVNKETMKLKQALEALENKIKGDSLEPNDQISVQLEDLRLKHNSHVEEKSQLQDRVLKLQEEFTDIQDNLQKRDEQIKKLQTDCDAAYDRGVEEGRSTVKTISQASYERGLKEGKAASNNQDAAVDQMFVKAQVTDEVKKVMNSVFFKLKGEFDVEETYSGKEAIGTILNVVREVTLKLVQKPAEEEEEEEEEDEESEEDEEEEEESEEESEEEADDEDTQENIVAAGKVEEKDEDVVPPDPSEESIGVSADAGLDVIGRASFDEVDVVGDKEENLPEIETSTIPEDVNVEAASMSSEAEIPEGKSNTLLKLESELSSDDDNDDDDDNASFSSVTSEPLGEEYTERKLQETSSGQTGQKKNTESLSDSVSDAEHTTGENKSGEKPEPEYPKNPLKEIGLDSSIFETSESEDSNAKVESELTPATEQNNAKDESSLFFGASAATTTTSSEATEDSSAAKIQENKRQTKETPSKDTPSKDTPSLFDDDDDDDFFAKAAEKSTTKKPSAFNRSPPPLFDDDDGETNWI